MPESSEKRGKAIEIKKKKFPVWKAQWTSPNPDQIFICIQSFHDSSTLLCAEENCFNCEVVEIHGQFPFLLLPWKAKYISLLAV